MKSQVIFEWVVEYTDKYGDIHDHDRGDTISDVWPAQRDVDGCAAVITLCRMRGNEEEGELDRGYAYKGDDRFCSGHGIPSKYKRILDEA
jgi:hypothetical protein